MPNTNADTAAAEAYASALVPGLFGPWAEDAVGWAEILDGEHVLDVACGTGAATRPAAERGGPSGRVVGVDIDPGMIPIARSSAAPADRPSLVWYCASAQLLPFDNHSFDALLCIQGLQFFPDRIGALLEMRRVMKESGRLLALIWCSLENCAGYLAIVQALERCEIDAVGARMPFSLGAGNRLEELLTQGGFPRIEFTVERKLGRFSTAEAFVDSVARGGPASRLALAKVPHDDWPAFMAEVSAALEPWVEGHWLRLPMESYVIRVQN